MGVVAGLLATRVGLARGVAGAVVCCIVAGRRGVVAPGRVGDARRCGPEVFHGVDSHGCSTVAAAESSGPGTAWPAAEGGSARKEKNALDKAESLVLERPRAADAAAAAATPAPA